MWSVIISLSGFFLAGEVFSAFCECGGGGFSGSFFAELIGDCRAVLLYEPVLGDI